MEGRMIHMKRKNRNKEDLRDTAIFEDEYELKDPVIMMENIDGFLPNPQRYIELDDAEIEWSWDPQSAKIKFLYTKAYKDFSKTSSLLLLGRTGTGKTAILRYLAEKVNRGKNANYNSAIVIEFDEILNVLAVDEIDFTDVNVIYTLQQIISACINTEIMLQLLFDAKNSGQELKKIRAYLSGKRLYKEENGSVVHDRIDKLLNSIKRAGDLPGKAGEHVNNVVAISDFMISLMENLRTCGYDDAFDEMRNILKEKEMLVLVDTAKNYNLRDKRVVLCTKALVSACFEFYKNAKRDHIWMKASIPSEVYTSLVNMLPGKQQGNTVIIQWSSKDLIKMIAMRLLEYSKKSISEDDSISIRFKRDYHYSDFYDENSEAFDNARALIWELLPKECPSSLRVENSNGTPLVFDTLAYCIRHTLKKPRELILIFNYFLTAIIDQEKGQNYFIDNPSEIKNYVHATQESVISSALSMYEPFYPNIQEACDMVLHGQMAVTWGKSFEENLRKAEGMIQRNIDIRSNNRMYGMYEIKQVLMESGLVGKMVTSSIVHLTGSEDGMTEICYRAVKATFEYQVKGQLKMHWDTKCVIHPMCYEHFGCKVKCQTVVYPDRMDQEGIISVRVKPQNS